jgi:hypothetical protein
MQETQQKTLRQKYAELSEGKKRLLIREFRRQFDMAYSTFFAKLNGTRPMRKPEQAFFTNNL